jgi:DNA primase
MRKDYQKNHFIDAYQLKEQIHPAEFYVREGHQVTTRGKKPWQLAGFCPFHVDKHAGSFYINVENGAYKCFSCGIGGGDIIDFTCKKYNISFKEAISELNNIWRVS